ncbi:competence protein ComEC [Alteromonadaceae bacterium 2753L.S.0a.02]|nr:competence protein ComEC [Alteromonadaceae bacterium 2753L.S.0a.02]
MQIPAIFRTDRKLPPVVYAGVMVIGLLAPALISMTYAQLLYVTKICGSVGLGLIFVVFLFNAQKFRVVFLTVSAMLLGFAVQGLQLTWLIKQQLPLPLQGQDLELELQIDSLPELRQRDGQEFSTRFYALVRGHHSCSQICDTLLGKRLRLSWYQQKDTQRFVEPGQTWRLSVRLKRPRGTANPSGFDYQAWLLARNVVASGYVRDKHPATLLHGASSPGFDGIRQELAKRLFGATQLQHGALLRALLIGDKSQLSNAQWQVLRATGTVHLMAISGLHIGLVASLGFFLGSLLARILSLLRPHGFLFIAPLFSILAAFTYAGLAGFEIPTQRALVMVCFANFAIWQGRRLGYWYIFVLALDMVLLLDPLAPLSAGFWLSFGAVAILLLAFGKRFTQRGKVKALLKAQLVLLIGMTVPLTLLGLPVALQSPLANIVAVPVVSFLVVPTLFVCALASAISASLSHTLLLLPNGCFELLWRYLDYLANLPLQRQILGWAQTPLLAALCRFTGLLLLLLPRGMGLRFAGCALLVIFMFPAPQSTPALRMSVLDVQQGLSVLIELDEYNLLYDTGAKFSDDFDMGGRVVLPYLQSLAKSNLDTLVISHSDNDHAGGAASVVSGIPVRRVLAGEPHRLKLPLSLVQPCVAGEQWRIGDTRFNVLWPPAERVVDRSNNASCVLSIRTPHHSFLLMGDIEKSVERELLSAGILPHAIDVLIAPHHGSRSSSSAALLARLKPKHVVFSVGYGNRYHHPNDTVVDRYLRLGAKNYRTDTDGAVLFQLDSGHQLTATRWRREHPHPWYW